MNRLKLRDIELAFEDSGSGPAIVLLHGYPFDRSMWREQIDFLNANGYRAIAPDLRGFGQTSDKFQFVANVDEGEPERQAEACRTSEIATMDEMARDVAALMDQLKIERATICGLSMGGYAAFEFVRLFAARVRGLVLAGTRAPADSEQERRAREEHVQRVLAEGMKPIADSTVPKLLAQRTLNEKPEVVARVREMILRTDPRGAAAAQHGMAARRDYSDDLAQTKPPTLIVVGREDTIRPVSDAEFVRRGLRDSHLEIIDDAAHLTNMEQPGLFNRILLRFLERSANN